ncbi:MarR family transcriptional regulator [Sphingomonas sp. HF-S4]|uniref:MarR family transcriptional regulator n=1 Tax=Sphingomonas agrestis TaxID=3080540 RepID=A0ABU3Y6Q1_9SPHN|nr:MarR family transcriptional regulator [Sphingomonas sp. HF-S4]MDV3457084.1 MarR family transcriptional regulator [Sphingomonas sp. HF-S4]
MGNNRVSKTKNIGVEPPSSTAEIGELDTILGLHIRRVHGAVQRHFGEHFGELGLTQKQISVLWLVGNHPGIAQTDIAQKLDMDRATAMTLVHALEKRGLMCRTPSESDRRRIAFELTLQGEALLAQAKAAITEHEAWLTGRFTAHELKQLRTLLARIYR